jgi:tetratricopeptide (TPR) repeat protein
LNPKHGDSYNNLGEIYATYYARPDSAIKYFEKAIEVAQRYKAYQIKNLAFAYAEAGKFQKAEEAFKYLIRDGMTTPNIYYHLALTHHFRGEKQEALRYCEKALEIDPDFIQAINYIKKERNKE